MRIRQITISWVSSIFSKHRNIGVISSKTRGLLVWWLHCLSLICLFNLIASVKLNNELYSLDYLHSVWSKWLPTWISKNQFVILVLDICFLLCQVGSKFKNRSNSFVQPPQCHITVMSLLVQNNVYVSGYQPLYLLFPLTRIVQENIQ